MGAGSKLPALSEITYNFAQTRVTLPLFSVAGVIESLYTLILRNQTGESRIGSYKCCDEKKGVIAKDLNHTDAIATITAGGVGQSYANIRLKSERGSGLNYQIELYV